MGVPALFVGDRLVSHSTHRQPTVSLLGDKQRERSVRLQPTETARAVAFRATLSGTTTGAMLFISGASRATKVGIAVYTNKSSHPGYRLTSGSTRDPKRKSWNRIVLRGTRLTAGRVYWVAVLGSGGALAYPDPAKSRCIGQIDRRSKLSALPARWSAGRSSRGCPISAYVIGHASATHKIQTPPPGPPTTTSTAPPTTTTTTPTSFPGTQKNCAAKPSACGYPDATNSGVPAGTALTNSGSITANTPGQVIKNVNIVNGSITVAASNVTIADSEITAGDGTASNGSGEAAVTIESGVTGTTIEYTTMQGSDCNGGSLLFGVLNGSADQLTMDHDYGQCLDDILHGSGTLSNSYSIDNANIPSDHYEPVAYDGGGGSLTINHDTLLNPHDQTAAVFTQCTFGDVSSLTIENSLVAGGGYVLYGPTSDSCGSGTGPESVTDNRFSRIYFPDGGQYGIDAYFPKGTTWSGNVWDDTLAAARM